MLCALDGWTQVVGTHVAKEFVQPHPAPNGTGAQDGCQGVPPDTGFRQPSAPGLLALDRPHPRQLVEQVALEPAPPGLTHLGCAQRLAEEGTAALGQLQPAAT